MGTAQRFDSPDGHVKLDWSHLPVVMATWAGGQSVEQIDAYFDATATMLDLIEATDEQAVMLTITDQAKRPSALVRRRITDRTAMLADQLARVFVANAVVVNNSVIRGALTAMGWVDPSLRVPYIQDLPRALRWARGELRSIGRDLPPSLGRHLTG